eukprot:scaffold1.g5185.t1
MDELTTLVAQLLALHEAGGSQDWQAGAVRILELRRAHRELCERTEEERQKTSDAKTQLDQSSLQLQNLLYEKQRYEKEIASCRAFKSAYTKQQLELLPESKFLSIKGIRDICSPEAGAHRMMMHRLAHELTWRQQTVKELEALRAKRDALAAEVAAKRGAVTGLEAEVGRLRTAALRVQAQYGVPAAAAGEAAAAAGEQAAGEQAAAEATAAGEAAEQQQGQQGQEPPQQEAGAGPQADAAAAMAVG